MSAVARRFSFEIDDEVKLDIEDMLKESPDEADEVIVYLEELRGDIELCKRLIDEGYEDERIRKVEPFYALQQQRYNAYTVRLWEVDKWRLITAADYRQHLIAVLYIMRRDEDYGAGAQARVIAAFERLGMDRMGH
ncbi:hypothetical protein [Sphingobium sp. Ant17]|uniref:hypothetical protein n=1 Tax=Sphingobium sp. Ant17 TaxID=1461752 RepID=UPI0004453139|nr:hypothetical protein [Sphingobium sp. Ant17]EXS68544.1 hypothetical protein BF95_19515 [Sphingobium sp. Ant17]